MVPRKQDYASVSVFRRHPKIDDQVLIQLIYYFCNGVSVKAVAGALDLSRKSVRAHFLELRARLKKPKFSRWHAAYSVIGTVGDPERERLIKGIVLEALAACHYSGCTKNYANGNRKNRICRTCPLPHAFRQSQKVTESIGVVDEVAAFYKRLGVRSDEKPDKLSVFFERLIHTSVITSVRENSKRHSNGLLDPSDYDFQAAGTLITILMDDLADDHTPRFDKPLLGNAQNPKTLHTLVCHTAE